MKWALQSFSLGISLGENRCKLFQMAYLEFIATAAALSVIRLRRPFDSYPIRSLDHLCSHCVLLVNALSGHSSLFRRSLSLLAISLTN